MPPAEACNPTKELRWNKLRLIFLYRMSNSTVFQNSLDYRENQNYVVNKETTKPLGIHLRKLEHGYIKE